MPGGEGAQHNTHLLVLKRDWKSHKACMLDLACAEVAITRKTVKAWLIDLHQMPLIDYCTAGI